MSELSRRLMVTGGNVTGLTDQLVAEGNRGARAVRRAVSNPESYIAATQLGITMASLGLGWIGEPALASMIQPLFQWLPATIAETTAHSIAVAIAFAIVTSLHIVLGELVPKTIALEKSERTALLLPDQSSVANDADALGHDAHGST